MALELQFDSTKISCLGPVLDEVKDHELTQEVKLSESMPDIGNILGAWGQVLIRGKEFDGRQVGVSGGVMAWVMYATEDGMQPYVVESWIPFQLQWDIPQSQNDCQICLMPNLRIVDARSVSARKIMIRANMGVQIIAMAPCQYEMYDPGQLPQEIQLNIKEYDMLMPCEVGEKTFALDEELQLPEHGEQLLKYHLVPTITETKVMAEKLVFRGSAVLHGLYRTGDKINHFSLDIPFAQYAQLEQEYDPDAAVMVYPVTNGLELELGEENRLRLKAGLTAQYIVCDRKQVKAIEDAYSTQNHLDLKMKKLELPTVLEQNDMALHAKCQWAEEGTVLDMVFMPEHPRCQKNPEGTDAMVSGRFQVLYYDGQDMLQGKVCKWEETVSIPAEDNVQIRMYITPEGDCTEMGGQKIRMQVLKVQNKEIPCVDALKIGELKQKDQDRPSLILRKAGYASLWEIAKETGSTIAHIQAANNLEDQPEPGQILLIPVS